MLFSMFWLMWGAGLMFMSLYEMLLMFMIVWLFCFVKMTSIMEYSMLEGSLYLDLLSFMLAVLSVWIVFMMSVCNYESGGKLLMWLNFIMLGVLLFCFFSSSMMFMYLYFEFSLIPLLLLILMNGSGFERLVSSFYLILFTLVASLPFLLLLLMNISNSIIFDYMYCFLNKKSSVLLMVMYFMFLFKMPMYGAHLWLPKAHVEAPVTGSMILAGLMLKMGGYGSYRMFNVVWVVDYLVVKLLIIVFSIVGALLTGFICLRQVDVKSLIAYSSVVHMGVVLGAIFNCSKLGALGSLGAMLAHGLCSSGLFYMMGCYYKRLKTRSIVVLKGFSVLFLGFLYWWFMFSIINLGVPPFMNFFMELLLVFSLLKMSMLMVLPLIFIMMLSAYYSLFLFMRVGHGNFWELNLVEKECMSEMVIIMLHFLPLLLYLMNVLLFIEWV